jgi:NADH-quinone oxidoreductase subunit L
MRRSGALRGAARHVHVVRPRLLAIIGFPGFSGFWSKDKIIETAFEHSWLVGIGAMLGAGSPRST